MASEPVPPLQAQPARSSDMVLRLQIGVGGVLVVLLLVGLAGIIGERAADQVASDAAAIGSAPANAPVTATTDQPLVDLGVQPAAPDAPVTSAVPMQPGTTVQDLPAGPPPKSGP